jgi:hypothetical protein
MHTPGHAVVNVAFIGTCTSPALAVPVLLGAVVPDLPIFFLYVRERLKRTPDDEIWSDFYQRRFWQNLVHGLHSIPMTLAGVLAGLVIGSVEVTAFFGSMLLHCASDLPIHVHDAHRHFLPFSHYRFISPFSYWDVRYHGRYVALIELALVWCASFLLWSWSLHVVARALLLIVDAWYAFNYYRSFVRRTLPDASP